MRNPLSAMQFFQETGYVGRVYADSLRDNFVGYTPTDQARFDALRTAFEAELALPQPYLAKLLTIESELLAVMPDGVVSARFWSLDDRFRRVVPLGTRDRYDAHVAKRGDPCWSNPTFLREQSRTLLDVIHSNYLLNIGREKSIKRLKGIMTAAASAITLALLAVYLSNPQRPFVQALVMLAGAGILGSFLSILNRMQQAVAVDAMTQDGIYELTGLRVGWVGILMSFVLGGGFALVIYAVTMAGMLGIADPTRSDPTASPAGGPTTATDRHAVSAADATVHDASSSTAPAPVAPTSTIVPTGAPRTGQPSTPASSVTPRTSSFTSHKRSPPEAGVTATLNSASDHGGAADAKRGSASTNPETCDPKAKECERVGSRLGDALGLAGGPNFFRMLMLAFLAGFAERFVPDILNRLSKQGNKAT